MLCFNLIMSSVTRCVYYFLRYLPIYIIEHLPNKTKKFVKVGSKFCQILVKLSKNSRRLFFAKVGKIRQIWSLCLWHRLPTHGDNFSKFHFKIVFEQSFVQNSNLEFVFGPFRKKGFCKPYFEISKLFLKEFYLLKLLSQIPGTWLSPVECRSRHHLFFLQLWLKNVKHLSTKKLKKFWISQMEAVGI